MSIGESDPIGPQEESETAEESALGPDDEGETAPVSAGDPDAPGPTATAPEQGPRRDAAGFGTGVRGKPRPAEVTAEIEAKVEQTYLKYGSVSATVRALQAWPDVTKLCGGKPIALGTVRRYLKKIRARWIEETEADRDHLRELHRRSLMRERAKAEDDGAWGSVIAARRMLAEIDGVVGGTVKVKHEGTLRVERGIDLSKLSLDRLRQLEEIAAEGEVEDGDAPPSPAAEPS